MPARGVLVVVTALLLAVTLHGREASVAGTVEVSLPPLAPVADAYVDAALPKKRFGTLSSLAAASAPVKTSYLRFDVSGVAGTVTRAILSVEAGTGSSVGLDARAMPSNSWNERTISYATAPQTGAVVGSSGPFAAAGRVAIDVSALVTGNGSVSIALTSASATTIGMLSREAGANGPRLDIRYSTVVTPAVTLTNPAAGSATSDSTPTFAGAAGDRSGDSPTVTVNVHRGSDVSAPLHQTLSVTRTGAMWAAEASPPLPDGVYTARATQADDAGDVGISLPATFTVDTVPSQPTLTQPAQGSTVTTSRPVFSGGAGTASGDGSTVAVEVYAGSTISGTPQQRLVAQRSGSSWSVTPSTALANGTYTARAEQVDAAGNIGRSASSSFAVDAPVSTALYRDTVLADAPRGYWRLGETSGTVAADAMGTISGTYLNGAALGTPGAITSDLDAAVRLDGVNDTVRILNAAALNSSSALSLEAFVRPSPLPTGTATLMRKDLQYLLRITSQGNLILRLWKGGAERELSTAGGVIPANTWSHVVATYDGATMRIYVNGRSRASQSLAAPVDSGTRDLYLGASINYDWLAGSVDEAAVYTKALSATAVQAHFDAAGIPDETPATVRLDTPESGATWDANVTYGGSASTDGTDEPTVTVSVYEGTAAAGSPVRSVTAGIRVAGTFSVRDATPLPSGTYTARASQRDAAGNVGLSQPSTFTVQADRDPHLITAGDIAACDTTGDEATAELLDGLPGTVVSIGDLVYEFASAADYDNCYDPTWGRQHARSRPTPGSHDYAEFQTNAEDYFAYFGPLAGEPGKGYYSYDVGTWHVIALNSNCSKVGGCGAGSVQERWLRADLAANPAGCTLAYWHDARFSSGSIHGSNNGYQAFWQALYDFNADVVLAGHEHVYERFAPQTPSGAADAVRGIRQFTVGTGGRGHYSFRNTVVPTSQVRNADTFGVLDLTLRPGAYDWRFVPEAGRTFTDSGSTACH